MVAQHTNTPQEPPRSLSPEVEAQLEQALRVFLTSAPAAVTDELRAALQAAGSDARDRQLRPEDLLLALKAIEQRIGVAIKDPAGVTDGIRARMIRAMLVAYFDR